MNNPYPDLATVLTASTASAADLSASPVSLATATAAVGQALALLDQQLSAVQNTNIVPNFAGAGAMVTALGQMKQAAGQWPAIKQSLLGAAQATVDAGPEARILGAGDSTNAAALAADVTAFVTSTLQPLQSGYSTAKEEFDAFASKLAAVQSSAAAANTDAVKALDAAQADIQSQIDGIHAQINELQSPGSIIAGIFTLGISIEEQLNKLNDAIGSLQSAEQSERPQQQAYSMAYSQFTNACSAEIVAVKAIATVNTALEQAVNTLNDITGSSSGNLTVMRAYVTVFRQEFAGAVTASQSMLN